MSNYAELARRRLTTRWGDYGHPEDYGYDFRDFVSPYTKSACNLRADVMLILQDWASHDGLTAGGFKPVIQKHGHDPELRTNIRLKELLRRHLNLRLVDTYATNAFVFIKPGGMSSNIPTGDVARSISNFTAPEIALVRPRLVLALGSRVAKALRAAGIDCVALPHPAARISNARMDTAWHAAANAMR